MTIKIIARSRSSCELNKQKREEGILTFSAHFGGTCTNKEIRGMLVKAEPTPGKISLKYKILNTSKSN